MLKLTALAIGLLTAISIVPAAQAANISGGSAPTIYQASDNLHAQIIIKVGGNNDHEGDRYREGYHRRQAELAREREAYEARVRWEAAQRRRYEYARYRRQERRDSYRRDDGNNRGIYRH